MSFISIPNDKIKSIYEKILRCRILEEFLLKAYRDGYVPGTLHLGIGHEGCVVGVIEALERGDLIIGTHRSHCHALSMGMTPEEIISEVLGKKTGCCGGKAGTLHLSKPSVNYLYSSSIVGSGIPIGVGVAYALKYLKRDNIVVVFVGDGAVNTGAFHEGLNLASIYDVPLLVIIENNWYAISVPIRRATKIEKLSLRANSYGIKGITIDGMNPLEVYVNVKPLVDYVRKEKEPVLVECIVYRFLGHHAGDVTQEYRSKEEVELWRKRDPLLLIEEEILKRNIMSREEMEVLKTNVKDEMERALDYALKAPYPEVEDMFKNVW